MPITKSSHFRLENGKGNLFTFLCAWPIPRTRIRDCLHVYLLFACKQNVYLFTNRKHVYKMHTFHFFKGGKFFSAALCVALYVWVYMYIYLFACLSFCIPLVCKMYTCKQSRMLPDIMRCIRICTTSKHVYTLANK